MKKALFLLSAVLLIAVMAIPVLAEFDLEDFTIPDTGVHFAFNGDAKDEFGNVTGELVGDPTFVEGRDGTANGAVSDEGNGLEVRSGDTLFFADAAAVFRALDNAALIERSEKRSVPGQFVSQAATLLILTVFQVLLALQLVQVTGEHAVSAALGFGALVLAEWSLYFLMRAMDRRGFELETLAFFLSTLGMAVCATADPAGTGREMLLLLYPTPSSTSAEPASMAAAKRPLLQFFSRIIIAPSSRSIRPNDPAPSQPNWAISIGA